MTGARRELTDRSWPADSSAARAPFRTSITASSRLLCDLAARSSKTSKMFVGRSMEAIIPLASHAHREPVSL